MHGMTLEQAVRGTLLIDGGLGTELERAGCDLSSPLWSARVLLFEPAQVVRVHQSYLDAGADCITTASYQISGEGFRRAGLSAEEADLALTTSVLLARQVRDQFHREHRRHALVAASVGPYGAMLADGSEFRGDYRVSLEDLIEFHLPRMTTLAAAGPDLLACETIPSRLEAEALLYCLRSLTSQKAAWFTFSCRDDQHVSHGEELAACGRLLNAEPQVAAIGVNCTAPRLITPLVRRLRRVTDKPILVYPNSGRSWDAQTRQWQGAPEPAAGLPAAEWLRAGARWFGGCCGTTPRDIAKLRAALPAPAA
jgi:homocysteine S-methyltransferase